MIVAIYDLLFHKTIQVHQVANHAGTRIHVAADGDLHNVIMPMAIRIVALAIGCQILFRRHRLVMQAMRS